MVASGVGGEQRGDGPPPGAAAGPGRAAGSAVRGPRGGWTATAVGRLAWPADGSGTRAECRCASALSVVIG